MRKNAVPTLPTPDLTGSVSVEQHLDVIAKLGDLTFFSDFPIAIFALNPSRELVFVNERCRSLLIGDLRDTYGLRPGAAFSCVHAAETPGGCGTTHFCRFCGLARTIAASVEGKVSSEECRFERSAGERSEQLDLFVWSKPLPFGDERYQLFAVVDISSEKRREVLERIFLHDLMNTATSVSSLLRLLDSEDPSFDEYLELAQGAADQLTEEILAHRSLRDAEHGQLAVERGYFSLQEAVSAVIRTYSRIAEARGVGFDVAAVPPAAANSDPTLVKRVLANLLKNAIEACSRGEHVSLSCSAASGMVELRIGNPAVMGQDVLANVFKRSFSTKGRGRGLGTYAARLFVEEYLGGTIRCESEVGKGTVFTVRLPA